MLASLDASCISGASVARKREYLMPATTDAPPPNSKIISLRIPIALDRELAALAQRDHNNVSATARRLISTGLRVEQELERRG